MQAIGSTIRRPSRAGAALRAALVTVSLFSPGVAFAGPPQDRVRQTLDAVSGVLHDPQLQGSAKERERRERVAKVMHESFDFREMARVSLGPHWTGLSPEQQEQFVGLFGDLFERSYDRLVLRFLGDSTAKYGSESLDGEHAVVGTTLLRKSDDELPVEYQLTSAAGSWKISDVVVDGVSLAANFRAQFDKTIRSESYDALVAKIKAKLAAEP